MAIYNKLFRATTLCSWVRQYCNADQTSIYCSGKLTSFHFYQIASESLLLGAYYCSPYSLVPGKWRSGFQRRVYANDALHAELLGVFWALSFAKDRNVNHLDTFTDCIKATHLIHKSEISNPILDHIAMLCRDHNHVFQEMKIQFCPRKLTQAADKLARKGRKEGIEMNVTRCIPNPPSYLLNIWEDFVLRLRATDS